VLASGSGLPDKSKWQKEEDVATVTSYTKDAIDAIVNALVTTGSIDGSNHLILVTKDGTHIDVGDINSGLDSDLIAIAALTPTNDDIIQRKAGAWTNRTMAQLATDLTATNSFQPKNSNLTTIAGLAPAANDVLQFKSSAWTNRTPTQLITDLLAVSGGIINTTAGNIAPIGSAAAAGANGKAADAAHVHLGFTTVAATALAGFTMTSGTPTILTYTTPNDGRPHQVLITGTMHVTVATTGGAVQAVYSAPDGLVTFTAAVSSATQAVGAHPAGGVTATVAPNTTITISQSSGVSAGAAKIWFGIISD
jgi:hypothetical protein